MNKRSKRRVCDWCCGGSILDYGTGCFRDLDSDLSYGIPVCGGCGGLGRIIENEDFKARTKRIMDLRFEYCPTDFSLPDVSIGVKVKKLEALIQEVTELFKIYGKETDKSFASAIAKGGLGPVLEPLRAKRDEIIALFNELFNESKPGQIKNPEIFRQAFIAAHSGDLDKADGFFKKLIEEDPFSSVLIHDYATYIVNFQRSYQDALPWFKKSIQLGPQKVIHFCQTINCMFKLKLFGEASEILPKAIALGMAEENDKLIKNLEEFKKVIDKEVSKNN